MAVNTVDHPDFVQQIIDKYKTDAAAKSQRNTGEMGKEEFLNLLVTQLRYQDPLNPVEDKEFIAQMAQFSALEQMQNMNASNNSMKGFSMIGKYVNAQIEDESTGIVREIDGHVESVKVQGSKTILVVDGKDVPIENVYKVADGFNTLSSSLSAYTGLIGFKVDGAVFDLTTGEVIPVNGEVESLMKGAYEDYALLNGVEARAIGVTDAATGAMIEDRGYLLDFLKRTDALPDEGGKRNISVYLSDSAGNEVPVSGKLVSYSYDEESGKVTVVMDQVPVPVSSVSTIKKGSAQVQKNTEQAAAEQVQENTEPTQESAEPVQENAGQAAAQAVTEEQAAAEQAAQIQESAEPVQGSTEQAAAAQVQDTDELADNAGQALAGG